MPGFKDRTGDKIGRLTVLCEAAQRTKQGRLMWHCRCDCGNEVVISSGDLYGGRTTSCGCLLSEKRAQMNRDGARHGHARLKEGGGRATTLTYRTWKAMLERCKNPNAPNYHLYGGKGIVVCERWQGRDGFANFLTDMGERPSKEITIDRKDGQKGYEPGNCRWADKKQQAANRAFSPEGRAIQLESLRRGRLNRH